MQTVFVLCAVFVAAALGQAQKEIASTSMMYQDPYTSRFITTCSDSQACTTPNAVCVNNRCVCGDGFVAYQDYEKYSDIYTASAYDRYEVVDDDADWITPMHDADWESPADAEDEDEEPIVDDDEETPEEVTPTSERRKRQAGTTSSPVGVVQGTSPASNFVAPVQQQNEGTTSRYPFMWGEKQSKEDQIRRAIASVVCAPVAQRDQSCENDVQCRATMGQNAQCQKFLDGVNGVCACFGGYEWTGGKCIYENQEPVAAAG